MGAFEKAAAAGLYDSLPAGVTQNDEQHKNGSTVTLSPLGRSLIGLGVFSAMALSLQASAPLLGNATAPGWLNWSLLVTLLAAMGLLGIRGQAEQRMAASSVFLLAGLTLWVGDGFDQARTEYLASELSGSLSSTIGGQPFLACLFGALLMGLAWAVHSAMQLASGQVGNKLLALLTWSAGGMIALVGLRALIGYVSGSPPLF